MAPDPIGRAGAVPHAYPGIDLLRALACTLVLVYHVIEVGRWYALPNTGIHFLWRHGWIGVDLFLVVSGFVIALSALRDVDTRGDGFRRSFARRRLARIVPLYLLTTLIFIVLIRPELMLMKPSQLLRHVGSHLLFIHNLMPATHGSINAPNWSVALEMQFYLAVLLTAPWLSRVRVVHLLAGALVLAALWRTATVLLLPPPAPHMVQFIYMTQLPGVIDEFALGITLALLVHRRQPWVVAWLLPNWRNCLAWLVASAAFLGLATWVYLQKGVTGLGVTLWRPLLATGFVALIGFAMAFPLAGHRWLAPLRYVGTISYGVYLWHMLVLLTLTAVSPTLKHVPLLFYVSVATLALAALSWHLLEKPNLQRFGSERPTHLKPALA